MTGKWSHSNTGRCKTTEVRMIRGNKHTSTRQTPRPVRCYQEMNHTGECTWRGVPFGIYVA